MQSISAIEFSIPKETAKNIRSAILNDLHAVYTEYAQDFSVKNKKRYFAYLKYKHPEVLKSGEFYKYKEEFKKAQLPDHQRFIEYIKKEDFRFWGRYSHLKGEEGNDSLRYMVSVARDKLHRKENVAQYVFGAVKDQQNEKEIL